MAIIIQIRRDTGANWSSANPVLAQGEIGLNLDNDLVKMGDGVTQWSSLDYYGTTASGVISHSLLTNLDSDDHPQYHTDARGDIRYYTQAQVDTISGALQTEIDDITFSGTGVTDHGDLTGLDDDDHPQYLLGNDFTIYSGTLQSQIDIKPDTFLELTDTPSAYNDGQYIRSTTSGVEWITASGVASTIGQVVKVGKGGAGVQFNTINDAIDSITDAAADKRYTIFVYPGTYTENIDFTGKPYISIAGQGGNFDTAITSSSGITLTPDNGSNFSISNIIIESVGGQAVHTPTGLGSNVTIFYNCSIQGVYYNTFYDLMEAESGILYFANTQLQYINVGTGGGTHRALYLSGDVTVVLSLIDVYMNVADVVGDVIALDEANATISTTIGTANVNLLRQGTVSGDTTFYSANGPLSTKKLSSSTINLYNAGSGGNGYVYKLANTACSVKSASCNISVTGFTNNYLADISTTSTLASHFDDVVAADNVTGAGTYKYVNSPSDGDLQISGSYFNMYDQALTVGERGADHTVIQDAIDAITDATVNKRYVILVYPGTYTENVDFTGKPYIDLKAVSTKTATTITSSTGVTLTLASQNTTINGIGLRTTGGKILEIPSVATTVEYAFENVSLKALINNSFTDAVEIKGGTTKFTSSKIDYTQSGTGGGTHRLINITGASTLVLGTTDMTMMVSAPGDDVIGVEEVNEVIPSVFVASGLVIARLGAVTGETVGYMANGTSNGKLFSSCFIMIINYGSGGNASVVKTVGNGCVVTMQSNTLKVLNFNNNWVANVASGDTVYSNFDTITADQEYTGAGVYNGVHANHLGDFHVKRDIILERNMSIGGDLTLSSGTSVDEITTSVQTPGSDDLLVTEKAIVGFTNGLADLYMKIDGSTPFSSTVAGVIPTLNSHLATKGYVDGMSGGGGGNDLGPFVTKSLYSPPGSEIIDDAYIVRTPASGVWSGHENDIATVSGTGPTSWLFEIPSAGKHGWVTDEGLDYTFNGTSWVATGSLIDHTTIQHIGINSHAAIDTHIANVTTNPHVVTKTNVGLANVTNDAQLKRSANDWLAFGGKTVTVDADKFLIEDSEDSQSKKYVLMGNIVDREVKVSVTDTTQDYLINKLIGTTDKITVTQLGAGGDETLQIGYGSELTELTDGSDTSLHTHDSTYIVGDGLQYSESEALSSTTSTTYQTKLGITFGVTVASGTYRIIWTMEYQATQSNKNVYVRLRNTTDAVNYGDVEQQTNSSTNWYTISGFKHVVFNSANKTFELQYAAGSSNCNVRNARISAWRVI